MKKIIIFLLLTFSVLGNHAYASILGMEELKINFTDKNDAKTKATWSEPDKINLTENGLGWDGEQNASCDSWIQTIPLAVGLSWRPAQSVNVTVEIEPEIKSVALPNGQAYTPYIGSMFVRYSPDAKHWSSWQAMDYSKTQGQAITKRKFTAFVNISQKERKEYISYMKKYWKLDVPWVSDEEALVKWILKHDQEFFNKHIPFIGYLQFLYEISLPGDQRIIEFHVRASFGLGGKHQTPKDKNVYKERDNIPWRFKVK
ncbi:MAG: hypothetical protein KAS51_07200 [Candidatus Omnitrophica bacterium]|nr:hypothetical protein [Candidatus Omnitrophota bacterium]